MNLFEAKRIAERNGYKVIKESEDKTVPPWAKKKAMLKEAREVVERAGYKVVSEMAGRPTRGSRMGIQGNGLSRTQLANIAEEWISNSPRSKFEVTCQSMGLEAAKAEFIAAVAEIEGHGMSGEWAKIIQNNLTNMDEDSAMGFISELMLGGNNLSKYKNGRRWC